MARTQRRIAKDMEGKPYSVGDKVLRVTASKITVEIHIVTVTRIAPDGRVYLDGGDVPLLQPERCLIATSIMHKLHYIEE